MTEVAGTLSGIEISDFELGSWEETLTFESLDRQNGIRSKRSHTQKNPTEEPKPGVLDRLSPIDAVEGNESEPVDLQH